ncbi:MAG TPA: hypothetical protein VM689_09010 [Aliidongia sp.]|nr:hypothetical protein [Aliidongia sp.]
MAGGSYNPDEARDEKGRWTSDGLSSRAGSGRVTAAWREKALPDSSASGTGMALAGHVALYLPPQMRRRVDWADQAQGTRLVRLLGCWNADAHLSDEVFRARYLSGGVEDATVRNLRMAAAEASKAATHGQLSDAARHLADAVRHVGIDRWSGFVERAAAKVDAQAAATGGALSSRDRAYLVRYYEPVVALAKKYSVDPMLVLALGAESGYATAGTYLKTHDAFGMTGGTTDHMTYASSPAENVRHFFAIYGAQIYGVGSDADAFLKALEGQDVTGAPVKAWRTYNSEFAEQWLKMVRDGIHQMRRDVPLYQALRKGE